jgi:hypothetical protein
MEDAGIFRWHQDCKVRCAVLKQDSQLFLAAALDCFLENMVTFGGLFDASHRSRCT